ncbi:MAG: dolichyl-phosphate beta-glucosyltransferase [Acidimicrobiales bacterium]
MTPDLTIIVPAFNEAHRLPEGMKRFDAAVAEGAVDLEHTEVVVIDDGSTDTTTATARSLLAHLPHHRVVTVPVNQGKGAAVRTGVTLARGAYTAYMDADMAIDPQAIPLLLEGLRTNDAAIGSRALPDSMVDGTYALRAVMGRLFNWMVTTGTGLGLHDTQCGFKAFRTPAARLLFHLVRIDRFAFDVEILARARRLGLRITEVPVQWKHVPGSTIHPLHDSIGMLEDVYRSRLGLLTVPPLPAVVIADPTASCPVDDLSGQVSAVVSGSLGGAPVPVVTDGVAVTVLLPLVDAEAAATALSALRAEFASMRVFRQSVTLERLVSFGSLTGRLRAASAPDGSV